MNADHGRVVQRFLPSEFGNNNRITHALPVSEFLFAPKVVVQDAIIAENIPYTFVVSNGYAGYFVDNLGQAGSSSSPKEIRQAYIYGHAKGPVWTVLFCASCCLFVIMTGFLESGLGV